MPERETYNIYVNFGHLAVDNGATSPIKKAFDIVKVSDSHLLPGQHYGDDRIEVKKDNLQIVIELLEESRIPYRIHLHPEDLTTIIRWRGIFSDRAKELCQVREDYYPSYKQLFF